VTPDPFESLIAKLNETLAAIRVSDDGPRPQATLEEIKTMVLQITAHIREIRAEVEGLRKGHG
jgi:hypothetical protein